MLLSSCTAGSQGKEKDSRPTAQTALFSTEPPAKAARSTALPPLQAWATTCSISSSRQDRQRLKPGVSGRRRGFRRTGSCQGVTGSGDSGCQGSKAPNPSTRTLGGQIFLAAFASHLCKTGSHSLTQGAAGVAPSLCPGYSLTALPHHYRQRWTPRPRPPLPTQAQSLEHPRCITLRCPAPTSPIVAKTSPK